MVWSQMIVPADQLTACNGIAMSGSLSVPIILDAPCTARSMCSSLCYRVEANTPTPRRASITGESV
jgi:hypothetical protein